ncbi:electron transport complex subunit RsxB [Martelella alba]|uniref:Ion-translocating oxidoreductase complex subunit B n=1 Tax=Martelella alba TaxID=2590451 RepID=A0ABY2SLC9_9HYPH|nr:electron transport complex subunit RsxB [Martelella alba]TKI05661.1 electron transport complex subunit RsxB [Martelella alba]
MTSLYYAIGSLSALALICGVLLGFAARRFRVQTDPVAEHIDALLPQSQCAQCGYPGCRPYAEAVAFQGEKINKCAPGGERVMLNIAALLNTAPQPLAETAVAAPPATVAWIDERNCIGCTKCLQVCPVDAIIGTARATHTVMADLCTGCDLCIAPCPTDCIEMRPVAESPATWRWNLALIPVRQQEAGPHV